MRTSSPAPAAPFAKAAYCAVSVVLVVVVAGGLATDEREPPRPAAAILADVRNVEWPGWISGVSEEEYARRIEVSARRECALIEELWRDHPEHPALPEKLLGRWTLLRNVFHANARVLDETNRLLEEGPAALGPAALYGRAYAVLSMPEVSAAKRRSLADAALAVDAPASDDGLKVGLLSNLAWNQTADPGEQRRLIARVLKQHRSEAGAAELVDLYRLLKHLGETPMLSGGDVLGGPPVSLESLRGRKTLLVVFSSHDFERGTSRFLAFEELMRARQRLGDAAPAVIGVLVDPDESRRERLLEHAKTYLIDFPVVHDASPVEADEAKSLAERLGIWNTPCFLELHADGRITRICGRAAPLLDGRGA